MKKIVTYSCMIWLGGSRDSCVPRKLVSAPEILVLRAEHGEDSVTRIFEDGEIEVDPNDLVGDLGARYNHDKVGAVLGHRVQNLPADLSKEGIHESMFGADTVGGIEAQNYETVKAENDELKAKLAKAEAKAKRSRSRRSSKKKTSTKPKK